MLDFLKGTFMKYHTMPSNHKTIWFTLTRAMLNETNCKGHR